jgi:hypothetical protein
MTRRDSRLYRTSSDFILKKTVALTNLRPLRLEDVVNNPNVSNDSKLKLKKLIKRGGLINSCTINSSGNVCSLVLHALDEDYSDIIFPDLTELWVYYPNPNCASFALSHCLIVEFLDLRNNDLSNIPILSKFIHLKELDLSHNNIQNITWFGDFSHLYFLKLSENEIQSLEGFKHITGCPNLEEIVLRNNKISDLCDFSTMTHFTKIEELDFTLNHVSVLSITHDVPGMKSLCFANNHISRIEAVKNLISLLSIDLSNKEFGEEENLNQIKRLENFENMPFLTIIDISRNPINYLSCLENLPFFKSLELTFSKEIQKKEIDNIIDYLHDLGLEGMYDINGNWVDTNVVYDTPLTFFGPSKTFIANDFITLKLFKGETRIYIKGKFFMVCKRLVLNFPLSDFDENSNAIYLNDDANSLDEIIDKSISNYSISDEFEFPIDEEMEFWAHCSNMSFWAENNYDSRFIHHNLAFPLLKALVDSGDKRAVRIFKEEIAKRLSSGVPSVITFLEKEGYLDYLSDEEFNSLPSS